MSKETDELNEKKKELDVELNKIREKKKEIDEKIKKGKIKKREKSKNGNCKGNKLIRVSVGFDEELEDVQDKRIEIGMDKAKVSKPKLTELTVKHNFWHTIKRDLINFDLLLPKNKSGVITIFMILLVFAGLFTLILLLAGGIVVVKMNEALDQDIDIGQVNIAELNEDTFGLFTTTYLNNADWWGMSIIFGLIIGLFLSAYTMRNTLPKWGIILDIFIILVIFILSLYMSSTYKTLLDALNIAGEDFLEVYAPKTSLFMINLPIFIVIIGVVMMILFHSSIPRKREERYQEGGSLQGAY